VIGESVEVPLGDGLPEEAGYGAAATGDHRLENARDPKRKR